jgi:hypothetical protein
MSDGSGRLLSPNPRRLIDRILDQPGLVAAVQALPAQALGRLVNHVGLEDAGELIALATTAQLERIFDDDLWHSPRPGVDEVFDADRFALWLEVMLEAGEEVAAARLVALPEDLVTLALHEQVLVIDIEALAIRMSSRAREHPDDDDLQVEKALESCLAEELGEYRLIARRPGSWDTLVTLLVALDRDHHDYLARLLGRLCALGEDFIEENGGLYHVLTQAESLAADVGAEREDRRAEQGYISPSGAASFLALARTTDLGTLLASQERDPVSRAYFRQLRDETPVPQPSAAATKTRPRAAAAATARLLALLREAEVVAPAPVPQRLLPSAPTATGEVEPLTSGLRRLAERAPDAHAARMRELGYLGNVLLAGCTLAGRSLRPVDAARAALATCNLGLERVLQGRQEAPLPLENLAADKLFLVGWHLLYHQVVVEAATTAESLLAAAVADRHAGQRDLAALRAAITAGKPWLARASLDVLHGTMEPPALVALTALLDECPSLAGRLAPGDERDRRFIATADELEAARRFLCRPA